MRLIGWDTAVQEKNNGLVLAEYKGDALDVLEVWDRETGLQETLTSWVLGTRPVLLAVDSPLGWPARFGALLADHRPGRGLDCDADRFFKRVTDQDIRRRFAKVPLEVSADRIARSAFFTLDRIETLRRDTSGECTLLWEPRDDFTVGLIEVYPAATLIAAGFDLRGYKKRENQPIREEFLRRLTELYSLKVPSSGVFTRVEHDFDALVCCLASSDFLAGRAVPPPEKEPEVLKEGWCWVREPSPPKAGIYDRIPGERRTPG